jgi:hypothetical protein
MGIRFAKLQFCGAALFAATFLMWSAGCAKIGEPQPPQINIPKPAADLAARQVADSIVLTVSKPVQNTNLTPAKTLQRVDVYRLADEANAGNDNPLSQEEFLNRASRIQSIQASSFARYLHDNDFIIPDNPQLSATTSATRTKAQRFRYAVLFLNGKNQAAGFSNQAIIRLIAIPPPPEALSAEVTEHSIKLKWKAPLENADGSSPAKIAGYTIHRSEDPDAFPFSPINETLLQQPEFEDRNFEFDKTYYYAVRIIGSLKDPPAESLLSKALSVAANDIFPPEPPKDLKALMEGGAVLLLWAPSPSAGVAGYRIYRQEKGSAEKQLLQNELTTTWSFRDNQAKPGKSYDYIVTAVDASKNKNESEAVRTTVEIK